MAIFGLKPSLKPNSADKIFDFFTDPIGSAAPHISSYSANTALMQDEMKFNANEANKSRLFDEHMFNRTVDANNQYQYNQFMNQQILDTQARDWQTGANHLAMEHSSAEARAQREWETEMSNTAHQREMADLSAAGLNPILASSFSGASTPNGSMGLGFANSSSGSSASSASVSSRGSNSASIGSRSPGKTMFDSVSSLVGNYLSNASKISKSVKAFESVFDNKDDKYLSDKELMRLAALAIKKM